jgi:DNA-binding NarL/FixJ family response regulator
MVVQAGAERVAHPDSPSVPVLEAIESSGREALVELRSMLGVLRGPQDEGTEPQPDLSSLPALVERVRDAGLPVELRTTGRGAVPPGIALSAYRVVQEALTNALRHGGEVPTVVLVDVGESADGRAAVDLAGRLHPDVVVMDIRMPVLDGIEATRLLAGVGVANPVRVLVVTTFNLDEYVYEALRAGASGFLLKDARPAQLLDGIRTVASGAALLAPEVTRELVGRYAARIRPPETGRDAALTPRELEVLRLIAEGLSNHEIAVTLVISQETVKTYVSRILTKLDLRDRVQAVVYAYRSGLVS